MEYWFKALEYQFCSTNTKPFFWEIEANLETLQKYFCYIGVSYKIYFPINFILESVKSLNQVFSAIEYCFKA